MKQNQTVDLNLKHYIGESSDVIKDVKSKISNYLRNPEISKVTRSIYSAIYNALTYYQNISDLSISGETENKTFLENTIAEFNRDYKYLSEKYNSSDPSAPKVIQAKGRIKSPISAFEKILEKISEYIKDGVDLKNLNNSLRDFIGLRIIIDAPPAIKAKGKQAEADFCYQVFNDLLTYRGINRQINKKISFEHDYRFIKVNTVHDPNKLQKMKERPKKEGFCYNPEELGIFIPTQRPNYVEKYDEYLKDYQMFPKPKLYQRLHICAHPYYAEFIPKQTPPNHIVPSTSTDVSIEYQVCTLDEEEFAEHGKASHSEYKGEREFHRLNTPKYLITDEKTDTIRLTRLDEAIRFFYGYTFEDLFNIDYQSFLRTFDAVQRDNILAGNLQVNFDEETQEYILKPVAKPLLVDTNQTTLKIKELLQNATPEELYSFYEKNGLLDCTISSSSSESATSSSYNKLFQIYELENQTEASKNKQVSLFNYNGNCNFNFNLDDDDGEK